MLCCDMLTTAHGLHVACSAFVCQVSAVVVSRLHIAVMLRPQNLHIYVPQDFWGKEQLE